LGSYPKKDFIAEESSMAGFGDLVQKAFYLGVGAASYAGEKAGGTLKELREQTTAVVNELVERGEITADEAQQLINKMMQQAQTAAPSPTAAKPPEQPRRIEIVDDAEDTAATQEAEALRRQVEATRQQLEELKRANGQ
jgi:polyhydroxyalkanoate synthesis regulator phasin